MNKVLSILIPVIDRHLPYLSVLMKMLTEQIDAGGFIDQVQIIVLPGETETTGFKRNALLEQATGEYIVFIDADDEVSPDYLSEILKALESKPDVVGFEGWVETDGVNRQNFKISKDLPYTATRQDDGRTCFLRYNNHLSPVRRSIALKIKFPDKTFAEDYDYATRLKESGLLQTEVYINKDLYHYKFISKR